MRFLTTFDEILFFLYLMPLWNKPIYNKSHKEQAEIFLLNGGEFFPFGTYINSKNEVVPFSAYIEDENDRPQSQPLIDLLEEGIRTRMNNGKCIIGALAYDIFVHESGERYDDIVVRIYENGNFVERCFKYSIHENHVDFF